MSSMPWRIVVVTDVGVDSGKPAAIASRGTGGTGGADAWLGSLGLSVALAGGKSHAVPSLDALAPAALSAALGGATGAAVDAVLHEPKVQRLESAWRGIALLASHLGEPVVLEALSVPRSSLVARFREALYEPAMESGDNLTLVVLDFDFTHKASDVADLAAIAAMASDLQACVVAHAHAGILDLRFLVQAAALQEVATKLSSSAHAGFSALQKSDDARWLSLTLNRFLLRAPWATDAHTEACSESNPDSYLWGRGGWLVAAALSRSIVAHGHALDLSGAGGRFAEMPTRGYPTKTNESQALTTEIPFAEMQMLMLAHAAFTPLVGPLNMDQINLPLVTTIHRLEPSKLTLEGTLAYQLTAARFALVCGAMLGDAPAGADDEATVAWLKSRLLADLAGMLKGATDEALVVAIETGDDGDRTAVVTLKPTVVLEGKNPEFTLALPLA